MHDKDHRGDGGRAPDAGPRRRLPTRTSTARRTWRSSHGCSRTGASNTSRRVRSVESALDGALAAAGEDDFVLVVGSLFAVAEARTRWTRTEIPKRIADVDDARDALNASHVGHTESRSNARQSGPPRGEDARPDPTGPVPQGGDAARSAANVPAPGSTSQNDENIDVLLMGTLAQFKRLAETLDRRPLRTVGLRRRPPRDVRHSAVDRRRRRRPRLPVGGPNRGDGNPQRDPGQFPRRRRVRRHRGRHRPRRSGWSKRAWTSSTSAARARAPVPRRSRSRRRSTASSPSSSESRPRRD